MSTLFKYSIVFLLICCLLFCFVGCTASDNSTEEENNTKKDTINEPIMTPQNWMSFIGDEMSLCDITVPGTHDSGSYKSDNIKVLGQTQKLSIQEQLDAGVRAFDIRVKAVDGILKIFHGFVDMDLAFEEVKSVMTNFLKANPSETIVMLIDDEENSYFDQNFYNCIQNEVANDDIFYLDDIIPTIGEARGKIVLFRRFSIPDKLGIDLDKDRCDDYEGCRIRDSIECYDRSYNDTNSIFMQDEYCLSGNKTIDYKWDVFTQIYTKAFVNASDLIINFVSCYEVCIVGGLELPLVAETAEKMNKIFLDEFPTFAKGCYGFIMNDYTTAKIAEVIYLKNF